MRPQPLPTRFELEGWRGQFRRLRRWHERVRQVRHLQSGDLADTELDVVYAFFQNAYHLRHWLENDGAATAKQLDRLFRTSPPLRIARDLCNGSKHLQMKPGQKSLKGVNVVVLREYEPGPVDTSGEAGSRMVVLADRKYGLWELVDACMSHWERFCAGLRPTTDPAQPEPTKPRLRD